MQEVEKLKFEIDQLRKDKIIYAIESCAVSLVCFVSMIFVNQYFADTARDLVSTLLVLSAVGYAIFMGLGNFNRLRKVKKLEKLLKAKL